MEIYSFSVDFCFCFGCRHRRTSVTCSLLCLGLDNLPGSQDGEAIDHEDICPAPEDNCHGRFCRPSLEIPSNRLCQVSSVGASAFGLCRARISTRQAKRHQSILSVLYHAEEYIFEMVAGYDRSDCWSCVGCRPDYCNSTSWVHDDWNPTKGSRNALKKTLREGESWRV